jgi:CheY-like chemotaxis protein
MGKPLVDILWAEDSVQDQHLVRAALEELKRRTKVNFVEDGAALLDLVGVARPRLVVLDLQMPRLGGLETLQRMRQSPSLRDLPVVVFTSSSHPQDVAECRRLGVVDYVTKPMEFGAFCTAVDRVLAAVRATKVPA